MTLSSSSITRFQNKIYRHYRLHGRDLPWRKRPTAYRVLVSEIMLQQTQVERVLLKYNQFLSAFPDFRSLARARLPKLLRIWSGMGYNRRALALRALARTVVEEHRGRLPSEFAKLLKLPGIGKYTAGAITVFAFNKPAVFMDTNIRRVYIHEFFRNRPVVLDDDIRPLIEQTVDAVNPRKWFNALMDYGSLLKREQVNPNRRSAQYTRQSPFKDSNRRLRGMILNALVQKSFLTATQIRETTGVDLSQLRRNLVQLEKEGFIKNRKGIYSIGQ